MNNHNPVATSVDSLDAFKQAFRRHAAGVAVVTSLSPTGSPVGFTATSLASLSAVPPTATFNMAQIASAFPAITPGNRVAIHMLGSRNRAQAERMAADNAARFAVDDWAQGPHGVPILDGVTAWMTGVVLEVHPVHANAVIVVQIEEGGLGEPDDALIYHERKYRAPGLHV